MSPPTPENAPGGAGDPRTDDARRRRRPESEGPVCERCGSAMLDRHCKVVCPNCGYQRDCSDP